MIVYNILLFFYFIISLPFYAWRIFGFEKYRVGLMERLWFTKKMPPAKRILVHTVSVGEFLGALSFINALRSKYPQYEVVVSTTTVTGNSVAKGKIGGLCKVVYFPLDFIFSVKRFFEMVSPSLVILVETELWPNFLSVCRKRNIPVMVVNGRISERSYKNYSKLKGFFRNMCLGINFWGVQFERDRDRLVNLGISVEKIRVTGSLKFDSAVQEVLDTKAIKRQWGVREDNLILVGGSTHKGEEKILLDIYRDIKDNFKNLILVLAPRHLQRARQIEDLINRYGFKYIKRSNWQIGTNLSNYEVVLVDTLGELISIYNLATIVFIGKSLVKGGGQNLLEPAGLGKPVICGPMMENFLDITQWLVGNGGVIQVKNAVELRQTILHLLKNPKERMDLGNRARSLILSATGAVERNMEIVDEVCKVST